MPDPSTDNGETTRSQADTTITAKPRLLFVDHSHHEKTRATRFLIEALAEDWSVEILWDESWKHDSDPLSATAINDKKSECVVFFQVLPRRRTLGKIKCNNIIWVPMRDGFAFSDRRWRRYRRSGIRIVSFCDEISCYLSGIGFPVFNARFFPPPTEPLSQPRTGGIVMWQRREEVSHQALAEILSEIPDSTVFTLLSRPDPGHSLQPPEFINRFSTIRTIEEWLPHDGYLNILNSASIYIQTRSHEGIGFGFLEAMARELCVVSPDNATMNEYIEHGVNGWLYSEESHPPLPAARVPALARNAQISITEGHSTWLSQKPTLLAFIGSQPVQRRSLIAW